MCEINACYSFALKKHELGCTDAISFHFESCLCLPDECKSRIHSSSSSFFFWSPATPGSKLSLFVSRFVLDM